MNEDSQCIVVIPVMQDTVHVVSASIPDLLRVEEIVWDLSDLCIASRFLHNYSYIFQEQISSIARVHQPGFL
jgi:hypothetical protein